MSDEISCASQENIKGMAKCEDVMLLTTINGFEVWAKQRLGVSVNLPLTRSV
jgi:hypothetical protein